MKNSPWLWLLALSVFLPACETTTPERRPESDPYYSIVVTDPRGHLITQWVAHGAVRRSELGYRFRAVERNTAGPFPQSIHYPEARPVEATGPNIVVSRCGAPLWLYRGSWSDK